MELRHLRYFTVLAEELHFGRAAERLFIAQPGLSRQIRKLEEELSVVLFDRNNRRVALTEAGKYFQQQTCRLLADLEATVANLRQIEKGLRGQLRIGYIGSAMQRTLPQLLVAVKRAYPDIRFSLREMDNRQQLEHLINREIDLGFVRVERVAPPLRMKAVLDDTFSLVLPENHPVSAENFRGLQQLADESFILFEPTYSESYYEKVLQLFDAAGFGPQLSHSTVNASSIYRLVANGMGLSIVPTALREGYDMGVKFIELDQLPQRTTLRAVWHGELQGALLRRVLGLL